MVTDFLTLIQMCDDELRQREYKNDHYQRIKACWDILSEWMLVHDYEEFTPEIGYAYCDEVFGTHLITEGISKATRLKLRSVRMLISYQKDGDFEFRTPKTEYTFSGDIGAVMSAYLRHNETVLQLSYRTIDNKKLYLYEFHLYLEKIQLSLDELCTDSMEGFFSYKNYTLASRHNASRTVRLFLRFAYDTGKTEKDMSVYVLPDNYKKNCKLPTTYEESEIQEILASVERSSAIGKRDYLILLLAAEYGWRSGDIIGFCFENIDWDNNVIHFDQHKTGNPVEFPLLSSVGNAIIDYLKNGRPKSDVSQVIVSADSARRGKPLSAPTVHSIVSKYMGKANIKNWKKKKHGAHALRHSLATNLLKKNVSMPVISTVMGHQNTETTKVYLSVDTEKLRQCVLPMPPLHSHYYRGEAER